MLHHVLHCKTAFQGELLGCSITLTLFKRVTIAEQSNSPVRFELFSLLEMMKVTLISSRITYKAPWGSGARNPSSPVSISHRKPANW